MPPVNFEQRDFEHMAHTVPSETLEDDVEETIECITQRIITRAEVAYALGFTKAEDAVGERVDVLMHEYGIDMTQAVDMARCWFEHHELVLRAKLAVQKMIAINQRQALTVAFYDWRAPQCGWEEPPIEEVIRTDQAVEYAAN